MSVTLDCHHDQRSAARALAADVRDGLTARPKSLPPKWFYDAVGSELFEQITRLEEYYPTRRERQILRLHAAEVAAATRPQTLIELGSGSAEKTRLLIDAARAAGSLRRYVPVDVSETALVSSGEAIGRDYPGLAVHGVVADFDRHLGQLPDGPGRLLAFLGSTIGNLEPPARARFLAAVATTLAPEEALLLGTDLVKAEDRLLRAYDDAAGITARFNRNLLAVINRELGADFDPDAFEHVAVWDSEQRWIEMRLRSRREQVVHLPALDLHVPFGSGEEMRTEISAKFTREQVRQEYAAAGLRLARWWTDPAGDYAVSLAVPR